MDLTVPRGKNRGEGCFFVVMINAPRRLMSRAVPEVNYAAVGYAISSAREKSSRHDSFRDNILQDFSLALEMTHNPASLALLNGSLLGQRRQGTVVSMDYAITAPGSARRRFRPPSPRSKRWAAGQKGRGLPAALKKLAALPDAALSWAQPVEAVKISA
jgi:hypothetical protein